MKYVAGFGINDLGYSVTSYDNEGKQIMCPFYGRWKHVISRAGSERDRGVYSDCFVCEDWIKASNFKGWMEKQDWQGLQLDKDILVPGNREYGPNTCVFVPQEINKLLLMPTKQKEDGLYGVYVRKDFKKKDLRYQGHISVYNGKAFKLKYLGIYDEELECHKAWQEAKVQNILDAIQRYEEMSCFRQDVKNSLLLRVNKIKSDIEKGLITQKLF